MTTWEIPLPHPDQSQVWDRDGDPWVSDRKKPPTGGGLWVNAAHGPGSNVLTWGELLTQFGPISDVQPRCEMQCYFGDDSNGYEQYERCLLALGHHEHHKLPPDRWTKP